MKNKVLLLFFAIFFVLILIGCSGVIPVIPDENQEEKVKEVINNYWSALSNKQYELAKTYCIPYADAYHAVEEYQNMFDYDYMTLDWITYINWVKIIGSKATVNINITLNVTVCFGDICSSESENLFNYLMYLIKIDDIWKLN